MTWVSGNCPVERKTCASILYDAKKRTLKDFKKCPHYKGCDSDRPGKDTLINCSVPNSILFIKE